jgi:hypothetical protein
MGSSSSKASLMRLSTDNASGAADALAAVPGEAGRMVRFMIPRFLFSFLSFVVGRVSSHASPGSSLSSHRSGQV